ncbi:MAG: sigma 54-interacting transcriptional regulator [Planctomycetes bacterium]|nr:sigma 54-interacting transcriptional regulator [Planctomycetota bacterium]
MTDYQLTVETEVGEATVHPIDRDITSIGRAEENQIQILDIKSSRNHCQIERGNGEYRLVDLESQNGTRVNGKKVNRHTLTIGDEIQIGTTVIRFDEVPAGKPATGAIKRKPRRDFRSSIHKRRLRSVTSLLRKKEEKEAGAAFEALEEALAAIEEKHGEEGLAVALEIASSALDREPAAGESDRLALLLRLQEVAKAMNSELNTAKLLDLIMDSVIDLTRAERGFLMLFHEGGKLSVEVARNIDKESLTKPEFEFSRSVVHQVHETGEAVVSADAQVDPRFTKSSVSVSNLQLRSVLCMPLLIRERMIGVVYIDNRYQEGLFEDEDVDILHSFADQAAIAIENARLHEDVTRKNAELQKSKEKVEQLNALLQEKVEHQRVELEDVKEVLGHKQAELELKYTYEQIVGESKAMRQVFQLLDKITDTDAPVFIHGESGTGKELVARAIHFNGPRKKERFVSENCAAISETLLESELFGYVKGAFTGADRDKKGLFEIADRGTLFLDEIGEMSALMQKKLLRVLQEGEFRRVGGKDPIHVDVRIISASNKDIKKLVEATTFREDLYYRINVITVNLPPLRDRKEDVPLLVQHFVERIARNSGAPVLEIDKEALRMLLNYHWPGNVRELENEITRGAALAGQRITPAVLSENLKGGRARGIDLAAVQGRGLKDLLREYTEALEKEVIELTLSESGGVKSEAARRLGISRPTLDAKIDTLGIRPPK